MEYFSETLVRVFKTCWRVSAQLVKAEKSYNYDSIRSTHFVFFQTLFVKFVEMLGRDKLGKPTKRFV